MAWRAFGPKAILLLAFGCGPAERFSAWPVFESEPYFFLQGQPGGFSKVHGPFAGVEAAANAPRRIELADDEDLFALGFSAEALGARHPRIDLSSSVSLRLEPVSSDCAEGEFEDDHTLRIPVSAVEFEAQRLDEADRWSPTPRAAELGAQLSLQVAYDDDRPCPGPKLGMTAFAAERVAIPDGTVLEGEARFRDVARDQHAFFNFSDLGFVDEDHLVAATFSRIFFFTRGDAFDPTRIYRPELPLVPAPGREIQLNAFARDPRSEGGPRTRFLVAYGSSLRGGSDPAPRGAIREISFDSTGHMEVGTATQTSHGLERIAIDQTGRFVAAGEGGFVVTGHVDRGVEEAFFLPERDPATDDVLVSADPEFPFVVVSDASRVFGIVPGQGLAGSRLLGPDLTLITSSSNAVWTKPDQSVEIWMSTFNDGVRRRAGDEWNDVSFELPAYAQACGATEPRCGQRRFDQALRTMVPLEDGRLLLGPFKCSGVVLLSPDSSCTDVLGFPGEALHAQTVSSFTKHDRLGSLVVISGNDGEVVLISP